MKHGWSRREFVKAASLAAGAAAVPRVFAFAGGSDRLRIGLIGCGGRGSGAAMDAILADPGNVLWAMGDAFQDRLDSSYGQITKSAADAECSAQVSVSPERRFVGFDAYKAVIDECDVVLLTAPPHFRPLHLRAAIDAGRHVFAEKPVAVDAWGVREFIQLSERAASRGLCLKSGFCWRHSNPTRAVAEQLHKGAIGAIRAVQTAYNTGPVWVHKRKPDWSDMTYQMRNWYYYTWLSGDHIVEQAIHNIDKTRWYLQDRNPARCVAVGGRQCRPDGTGHIYDHFAVCYEYDDPPSTARAFHMCRQFPNCPGDNNDFVMGETGTAFINSWDPSQIYITGENPWKCDARSNNMYRQEHIELFAAIRSGSTLNDGVSAAHSTLMAIMGRMAAYTGQVVTWDQALNSAERLGPERYDWDLPLPEPPVAMPGQTPLI